MQGIGEEPPAVVARVATRSEVPQVTEILAAAFRNDPLWRWVFRDPDGLAVWWRFLIGSALRYPWVFVGDDYAAASVWIPVGASELTPSEEDEVEPLLEELLGARAAMALELLERFEAAHPRERPHYYLSLLGVRPESRGAGLGMSLLAENLARIDREGAPAYLESSNPENVTRYERLGFERIGEFSTPDESHTVTTMWRAGR
jgi:GNAT superfamily N-acetyltransferase